MDTYVYGSKRCNLCADPIRLLKSGVNPISNRCPKCLNYSSINLLIVL